MHNRRLSILEVIRRSNYFSDLDEEQLDKVVELCREDSYAAGEAIFAEGSQPKDFYIVERGRVALDANFSARPGSWKRGTVDVITDNQGLGWSALAGLEALTLSARAIEDTQLLAIDGIALRALLEQDPRMGYAVMRRAVAAASARMQNTKETLARILSIAAHDLRAPLNAVQTYISVMAGGFFGPISDQQKDILARCTERLTEFSDLIENILDITRFEEGYLPKEPLCLSELLQDTVELLRPVATQGEVSLELEMPPLPLWVEGSSGRLRQVMSNLLGNAIKFTPSGGSVQVFLKADDGQVLVEVCDTGIGIRAEDLPRIFDEFYQGAAAEARTGPVMDAKGVGLGLSICQKIVAAHRGRIWAESPCPNTGRGSLFCFTLPRTMVETDNGGGRGASARKGVSGNGREEAPDRG